jgi:glycosyltransferase involved in cell wall biosynthesis
MSPYFSIIIPTYNRAKRLQETVTSVLNQTFQNFEIIVVDDGSTDSTHEVTKLIADNRVKYFYKINEERGIARNYGLSRSTGEYVSFLDSDDLIYSTHLQVIYENILRLNSPEVLHSDYEFQEENGNVRSRGTKLPSLLNHHLLENSQIGVLGVFIRRDIALKHLFIPHRSAIVAEDLFVWLTLAARYPFHHVPEVTGAIVLHDGRSVNNRNASKFLKGALLIIKNLSKDDEFIKYYSRSRANYFFAKSLIQVALIYSEEGRLKQAFKLLCRGIHFSVRIVFNRTFLATVKMIGIKLTK